MEKDIFKKLGESCEKELLRQQALEKMVGGKTSRTITILQPKTGKNIFDMCPGNVCDPFNYGACAGNTVLGGPRTCPL